MCRDLVSSRGSTFYLAIDSVNDMVKVSRANGNELFWIGENLFRIDYIYAYSYQYWMEDDET